MDIRQLDLLGHNVHDKKRFHNINTEGCHWTWEPFENFKQSTLGPACNEFGNNEHPTTADTFLCHVKIGPRTNINCSRAVSFVYG